MYTSINITMNRIYYYRIITLLIEYVTIEYYHYYSVLLLIEYITNNSL